MSLFMSYRLFAIAGIPVYFHWSTLLMFGVLLASSMKYGVALLIAAFALLALMLVHELGHAFVARHFGYEVIRIALFPLIGQCHYQRPHNAFEDAAIAWGGVAAQRILLVPAVAILVFFGNTFSGPVNAVLMVFSYINAMVIVVNLVPSRGLDGMKAWRLIPMLFKAKRI